MKLKKCSKCKEYTIRSNCKKCNIKTNDAHYKFIKFIKDSSNSLKNSDIPPSEN